VLAALENSRHRDNTLILFSVDHGDAAGCHRMFQKFTLYEESIHVPFIVSSLGDRFGLGRGRFDREHFVSGVDFLPTVCDYASVEVPAPVSGTSLRAVLENRDVAWRDFAYVESNYWGRAIVTERFKYACEYVPKENEDFIPPGPDTAALGREQLFDMAADPGETRNLARSGEHANALQEHRARLQTFERTLNRRPMHPDCHNLIRQWGGRIKERWATVRGN
jgi:arylsulfatase A-like enzyme